MLLIVTPSIGIKKKSSRRNCDQFICKRSMQQLPENNYYSPLSGAIRGGQDEELNPLCVKVLNGSVRADINGNTISILT